MRRAAKVDANQTEIVQALRQIGAVVRVRVSVRIHIVAERLRAAVVDPVECCIILDARIIVQ